MEWLNFINLVFTLSFFAFIVQAEDTQQGRHITISEQDLANFLPSLTHSLSLFNWPANTPKPYQPPPTKKTKPIYIHVHPPKEERPPQHYPYYPYYPSYPYPPPHHYWPKPEEPTRKPTPKPEEPTRTTTPKSQTTKPPHTPRPETTTPKSETTKQPHTPRPETTTPKPATTEHTKKPHTPRPTVNPTEPQLKVENPGHARPAPEYSYYPYHYYPQLPPFAYYPLPKPHNSRPETPSQTPGERDVAEEIANPQPVRTRKPVHHKFSSSPAADYIHHLHYPDLATYEYHHLPKPHKPSQTPHYWHKPEESEYPYHTNYPQLSPYDFNPLPETSPTYPEESDLAEEIVYQKPVKPGKPVHSKPSSLTAFEYSHYPQYQHLHLSKPQKPRPETPYPYTEEPDVPEETEHIKPVKPVHAKPPSSTASEYSYHTHYSQPSTYGYNHLPKPHKPRPVTTLPSSEELEETQHPTLVKPGNPVNPANPQFANSPYYSQLPPYSYNNLPFYSATSSSGLSPGGPYFVIINPLGSGHHYNGPHQNKPTFVRPPPETPVSVSTGVDIPDMTAPGEGPNQHETSFDWPIREPSIAVIPGANIPVANLPESNNQDRNTRKSPHLRYYDENQEIVKNFEYIDPTEDDYDEEQNDEEIENEAEDEVYGTPRDISFNDIKITSDNSDINDSDAINTKDVKFPFDFVLGEKRPRKKVIDQVAMVYLRNFKKGRQLRQ